MKKYDLVKILVDKKVPSQMYSLGDIGRGECYCVVEDSGSWKVSFAERGKVTDIKTGLSEEEAYDLVYKEFKSMYGWKN